MRRQAGEQLNELDPPSLPIAIRYRIVITSLASVRVSLILGLALAGVQEARDTSLKNLKDVRAYTNLPVLSSIPLLENRCSWSGNDDSLTWRGAPASFWVLSP